VGRSLSKLLKHKFPKHSDKISFVPNGMLPTLTGKISPDYLPKDLDFDANSYILTVGRLVPEKGFHDLVEAYKQTNVSAKLVIVGDADHEDDYSKSLKRSASSNIIFAGRRSGDELKSLYQHASVFVLPSYHEGLPIVALEAISAGSKVLLSDISPNIDIEAPSDSYFKVGNVQELSVKLSTLPELNLNLDREEFLKKYDWESIASTTFGHAKNLVS